jgi:hypothetical protein
MKLDKEFSYEFQDNPVNDNPDSYFLRKDIDPCDNYWEDLARSV